jgi:predicted enzyme related to lactoylglutathione lyase
MQNVKRLMTNICTSKMKQSKDFYTTLFNFKVNYDSNWFVQLISADKQLELGIINSESEIVPNDITTHPQGFYLTFVVDDLNEIFEIAKAQDFQIMSGPLNTVYGQRQLLIKDPNGIVIDVSSPILKS